MNGYPSNGCLSFGLRSISETSSYSCERTAPAPLKGLVKYSSLYKPAQLPFMVDTANPARKTDLSYPGAKHQWGIWYMSGGTWHSEGFCGALDMRHNKKANVWMPDGHVTKWGESDARQFKAPWSGNPTFDIGFVYGYSLYF